MAADEIDTLLESEKEPKEQMVPVSRVSELSNKAKKALEEKEAESKARQDAETKAATAEKKASFYKDFSKVASKYQGASDHMDEIEAKVMSGYDTEDAVVSVLNKAGKFTAAPPEKPIVAGGSASTTTIKDTSSKTLDEMSRDEKRQALIDIENETGGISRILERKSLS